MPKTMTSTKSVNFLTVLNGHANSLSGVHSVKYEDDEIYSAVDFEAMFNVFLFTS
jgi:hypothetical protein